MTNSNANKTIQLLPSVLPGTNGGTAVVMVEVLTLVVSTLELVGSSSGDDTRDDVEVASSSGDMVTE